jgi:hypothetical protein
MSYPNTQYVSFDRSAKHTAWWRSIWLGLPCCLLAYAWICMAMPLLELPAPGPGFYILFGLVVSGVMWAQSNLGSYTEEMARRLCEGDSRDIALASRIRRFRDQRVFALIGLGCAALAAVTSPYAWLPAAFLGFTTLVREVWWLLVRR